MKSLRYVLSALVFLGLLGSARAGDDDKVTAQIRAFYRWYIPLLESSQDREILQHHRKEMSRYVTANLLAKIARFKADSQEGDYFVESLDTDREWVKNISVRNVKILSKGRASAEVLLTAKATGKTQLKVTLVLAGGKYKIDEVENSPDDSDLAPDLARIFYVQYLYHLGRATGHETPMDQQEIRDGVTADCLKKAAASASGGQKIDYFLQSTDWDPAWKYSVETKLIELTPDSARGTVEILLTGEHLPNVRLKVSLRHEQDTFKIDGVERLSD